MATRGDGGVRRGSMPLGRSRARWLWIAAALLGCAAGSGVNERYPEKKRPEPLRSASDGEVMGADEISPEDRLEASPTTEHGAIGSPHVEHNDADGARDRLEYEQCLEAARAAEASAPGGRPAKKRVCKPPPGSATQP